MGDTELLAAVRATAEAVAVLAEVIRGVRPQVEARVQRARSVSETAWLTVALVGESPASRCAVVNALLGSAMLSPVPTGARDLRVTILRRSEEIDYRAHSRDGRRVLSFSRKMPPRRDDLEATLAKTEGERADAIRESNAAKARATAAREQAREAEAELAAAEGELARAGAATGAARDALVEAEEALKSVDAEVEATQRPPSYIVARPAWWAVWLWLLRLVLWPFWRDRLLLGEERVAEAARARDEAAAQTKASAAAAAAHVAAKERQRVAADRCQEKITEAAKLELDAAVDEPLERAKAAVEKARAARNAYAKEREAGFEADLRAMGEKIAELSVDYPAPGLPDGVTLVELPSASTDDGRRIAREAALDADAVLVVEDARRPPGAEATSFYDELGGRLARIPPIAAQGETLVTDAAALFARVHARQPLVLAAGVAAGLRAAVAEVARARDEAEERHAKRLASLEASRIPDANEVRTSLTGRVRGAVERGASDAGLAAEELVRARIAALRAEWTKEVTEAADRGAIEAWVKSVNANASARIGGIMDEATENVARDLQGVVESIQTWALEEIHSRYQLARRIGAESLTPLASELTREDLELVTGAPAVAGALEAFEKQRVGIGLGGVAAGALLGTLVFPGIGTAIGAFVGVFAGFFKGVDSLRHDCLAKIDACIGDAERHALERLAAKRGDMERLLGETVEASLREAFDQLEQAISRLVAVEKRAIAAERERLRVLGETRAPLEEHAKRLDGLVEETKKEMEQLAVTP
jgi:hypothetical protein